MRRQDKRERIDERAKSDRRCSAERGEIVLQTVFEWKHEWKHKGKTTAGPPSRRVIVMLGLLYHAKVEDQEYIAQVEKK